MANTRKLTHDELLKLKAVVLYIVNKCEAIDYFHIFKILYFADRDHYAKYGRRIIQDTFCALPKGPVPSFLFDAIKVASNQTKVNADSPLNIIASSLEAPDESCYFILGAKEQPDMDELSRSDIEMIDKSILENKILSVSELSNKSHDEAWQEAWNTRQSSPMADISIAKAGGANDAMIGYIRENEEINCLFC